MPAYHLIQMKPTKTYLSVVDPNKKSRFVCFDKKDTADVFVNYVTNFRSKHGYWPSLDMSNRLATVRSKTGIKKRTPEELKKYLSLETFDYENIEEIAMRTNVSLDRVPGAWGKVDCKLNYDAVKVCSWRRISQPFFITDAIGTSNKHACASHSGVRVTVGSSLSICPRRPGPLDFGVFWFLRPR